jgi:hypothetical protein
VEEAGSREGLSFGEDSWFGAEDGARRRPLFVSLGTFGLAPAPHERPQPLPTCHCRPVRQLEHSHDTQRQSFQRAGTPAERAEQIGLELALSLQPQWTW